MLTSSLMSRLVENAVEFLSSAIETFQTQPKNSIIDFYTAVELFLKARLLHEHWSLVVLKDADRQKFEAGDFTSVTFEGACERLQKIVQSPVPEEAKKNFDTIRKHRNKMVHFFHDADRNSGPKIEAIAREQLRAWYDLQQLLTVQWANVFSAYKTKFQDIEQKLKGHKEYLRAKFERLEAHIGLEKVSGSEFRDCGSCRFEAAKVHRLIGNLLETKCLVCGYRDKWLDYNCDECGTVSPFHGADFICESCGHSEGESSIIDALNEFVGTSDNYLDAMVPANCSECGGYQTIIEYRNEFLCVSCLEITKELELCGSCGEFNNGDMKHSSLTGCSACEGSAGWHKDD